MEDGKIKSALEIALEKAASMPRLTQEELLEQKEREYKPRGVAIANKYLEGALKERDLPTELHKYSGEEGSIARKAFLLALCQSITLEDMRKSLRAIDGIQMVVANANLKEMRTEVEAISREFSRQRDQKYVIFEHLEKEKLRALGITGSAVRPNLKESRDWGQELKRIRSEYDSRLNKITKDLSELVGA